LLGFAFWNIHSQSQQNRAASLEASRSYASKYISEDEWQVISPDAKESLHSICSRIIKGPYEKVLGCIVATLYKNGEKFSATDENYFLYLPEKYNFPANPE